MSRCTIKSPKIDTGALVAAGDYVALASLHDWTSVIAVTDAALAELVELRDAGTRAKEAVRVLILCEAWIVTVTVCFAKRGL